MLLSVGSAFALTVLYCLPLPTALTETDYATVLYARDGELLGATIAGDEQWRFPPVSSLPEKYKTAVMAFEDSRFYYHPGVDPLAIVRAAASDIKNGRIVSGGSTITMQVARLLRGNPPRTFSEKFTEAIVALQLEMHFSKEEIFNLYANFAPFGGNHIGIAAASWRYFGHDIAHMTWAEAALFAVLPNKPTSIHPGQNRQRLLERRNNLLQRLYRQGHLSTLDLQLALLESLPEQPKTLPNSAPHLLATLKERLPDQHEFTSTIDNGLQQQVNNLASAHSNKLGPNNINNLAVLVLDNDTQQVVAYVGNRVYQTRDSGINEIYSPALDIIQRPRSSGSLFKPFLFAMMLQQGLLLPDSLILDVPSYYNGYSPENYDRTYRGAIPAKFALSQSLNVPAVRLLQRYGVTPFKHDLQNVGLSTLFRPADDYGLSLILGGAETTLWDITNAYAGLSMSAQGEVENISQAHLLLNENASMAQLSHEQTQRSFPIKPFPVKQGAAWLTLNALLEVHRPGVGAAWRDFSSSQKIAWKTGTSFGWHDAWAVGTNGRYTVGVWAGNANGEEGRNLTGAKAAAPLLFDVFAALPAGQWPQTPYRALKTYRVCADGYLSVNGCAEHNVLAPIEARFTQQSPYYVQVHTDPDSGLRVHGLCQPVSDMKTSTIFQLPPVAAYYYQRHVGSYKTLPAWRHDCVEKINLVADVAPLELEYPSEGGAIHIPVEINGQLGRAIFKAKHYSSNATVYWHLDNNYLGDTHSIHEKAVVANPGWHKLTLVDDQGYRVERWFRVI